MECEKKATINTFFPSLNKKELDVQLYMIPCTVYYILSRKYPWNLGRERTTWSWIYDLSIIEWVKEGFFPSFHRIRLKHTIHLDRLQHHSKFSSSLQTLLNLFYHFDYYAHGIYYFRFAITSFFVPRVDKAKFLHLHTVYNFTLLSEGVFNIMSTDW